MQENTMHADALASKVAKNVSRHGNDYVGQTTCIIIPEFILSS